MDTQPLQQVPRSQEFAGRLLFVIILFLFLNGPGNQAPAGAGFPSARDYAQERITRSRQQLDVLNRTRWQDFAPKGYDTPGYEPGSKASRKEWVKGEEEKNGPGFVGQVYNNITGVVVGEWVRYEKDLGLKDQLTRHLNLTEISPHTDWAFTNEKFWTRNITGQEGKLLLRIDEKDVEELDLGDTSVGKRNAAWVREVGATMTIQDETSSGDGWEMRVHGVHWPRTGVVLMTTTSDKFAGVFGLPHLATNAGYYTSSQKLLNMTLEKTVERMEKAVWIDPSNPWTSSPDSQGDAMMPTPHCEFLVYAQVHPVVYPSISPRGENSLGRQKYIGEIEQELRFPNGAPIPPAPELKMSTVIFSPDCGFILESKGPPDFSHADGEHLVGLKQEVWLNDIEYWLLVFAVVMSAQILLLKAQSKEASTPSTVGRAASSDTSASSWSKPWRSAYIHLLSLTYLSFWVPQIRRNVIRNCRKALLWRFIIGQSILRLLPFAYFYLREDNFLFADPDWKAFCVYAGWVWIQVWMLVAQEILGPRWGIPKGWTEEGWDYHPILREDNVEAGGLPIGLVQVPNSPTLQRTDSGSSEDRKKKEGTVMSLDCAICMQNLEVPVVAAGEDAAGATGVAGMLARRQYMVTPCRHMFHSMCFILSRVFY
ncbi:putative Uncharacterized RING finger protein [Glarea lozoyensis 74030]|uniref:RING-type E3 ubiquitin transferase n=1 Tax=Glarea lozoyensis (strain ATCC 74030 / MF5533) TaxID=1104152 RepID=H0ED09_GLAL7|nr:putative Uncharacterized RING finger protein [Glarea lozoyensis 74030]